MQGQLNKEDVRVRTIGCSKKKHDVAPHAVKGLLVCGILSSPLYVAMDALAALRYEGYSYTSQAVSELNATGAPTRSFFLALAVPYNVLLTALGAGVWAAAGRKRAARLTAASLVASAAVGMVTPLFFPMDQRGAEGTLRGNLHPPLTAVGSLFILLAMGFGSTLLGRRFRLYSFGTILTLLVFGGWTALDAPQVAAGESTPWLGIKERINIYAYLLWVVVLATSLLQRPGHGRSRPWRAGQGL